MPLDRREFLHWAAAGTVAGALGGRYAQLAPQPAPGPVPPPTSRPVKAVAFDAFAIFDPRPIAALCEALFPGQGALLGDAWRARQFEYQWLRSLGGRYADFERTTEDALVFAARQKGLELPPEKRARLMQAWLELKAWPDVAPALESLKKAGVRLAFLSNMTPRLLAAGIANSGLAGAFDPVLSTDERKVFKPDPRAYQFALDALRLEREEIVFVPFAGWDVAGAKWFGFPTCWVNRAGAPGEELGVAPDATGSDLGELVRFVEAAR
jgi:2-haloacid dehalogenase